jgi:Histidine phosphatase superfamily (branch 2)
LFRKIGNRSSEFFPNINEVRRDGRSYIYEEFVETQGTDVKMYSVGPEYGHAEARKSPTMDGIVERNQDGKEVRFPVILTFREKEISRRIVLVFKQFVCGFDILRVQDDSNGHSFVSYVCDVNGWSFVKNSRKYFDDCAQILSEHILCSIKPDVHRSFSTLNPLVMTSLNRESGGSLAIAAAKTIMAKEEVRKKRNLLRQRSTKCSTDVVDTDTTSAYGMSVTESNMCCGELSNIHDATTLVEGALPVREFPDSLTLEPPPMIGKNDSTGFSKKIDEEEYVPHSSINSNTFPSWGKSKKHRSDSFAGTHQEELRCVIAIVRHGDRTPKQKLKMDIKEPHILRYFHEQ